MTTTDPNFRRVAITIDFNINSESDLKEQLEQFLNNLEYSLGEYDQHFNYNVDFMKPDDRN